MLSQLLLPLMLLAVRPAYLPLPADVWAESNGSLLCTFLGSLRLGLHRKEEQTTHVDMSEKSAGFYCCSWDACRSAALTTQGQH
jgi:hypothetical protein